MSGFAAKEPLILFEIGKALSEGRDCQDAVQSAWKIDLKRAREYRLVLGKAAGRIVCAYRPVEGSWHRRHDGRWCFASVRADDVWNDYVGQTVPDKYLVRAPFQYL